MNRLPPPFMIAFFVSTMVVGQSMSISHSGLSPVDTLTVYVGQDITFYYGGGQAHPMTEGWASGQSSTPMPFPTQTVSSTVQSKVFHMDSIGVYYFHCGNNPSNSSNWGKITVVDSAGTVGLSPLTALPEFRAYPNPVDEVLTVEGLIGTATIHDMRGALLMTFSSTTVNVSHLPAGTYVVESANRGVRFVVK